MSRSVVELEGVDKLVQKLQQLEDTGSAAISAALYEEGFALDANMVARIPVDTGRLRSTHYVAPPTRDGDGIFVEVGVGTDYAVAVHERTEARHAVGEAKFLERALAARSAGMGARIAALIWKHIEAGTKTTPLKANPPARPKDTKARDKSGKGRPKKRAPGR